MAELVCQNRRSVTFAKARDRSGALPMLSAAHQCRKSTAQEVWLLAGLGGRVVVIGRAVGLFGAAGLGAPPGLPTTERGAVKTARYAASRHAGQSRAGATPGTNLGIQWVW